MVQQMKFFDSLVSKDGANALMGFGSGMLSGGLRGAGPGLMQGMALDRQYAMDAQQQARQEEERNLTMEWVRANYPEYGNLPPDQAFSLAAQAASAKTDLAMGGGSTEYGLTPIWGQFEDGTFGYGVQGKDGSFLQVDTGGLRPLDPRTLAGERAYGTAVGGAQGDAVAAAPGDIANAMTALDLLSQIESSPELPWATGMSAGMGGNRIPGTGRFGFQNMVDQAKSGAFLSAIQEMRGLGALSNAEGQVATAAVTRMDTALSEADFRKALADYRAIIERALARAQGRVGMQPNVNTPTAAPMAAQPQPGPAPSGRTLTFNPATGRLE